jgi:repressor LexA
MELLYLFPICTSIMTGDFKIMLTKKQKDLLMFIHEKIRETGVSPSFEEMKNALDLRSKSGVHKLLTSLEERGFIRKIPNKARALEILQLPDAMAPLASMHGTATTDEQVDNSSIVNVDFNNPGANIPVMGKIAAGVPVSAIANHTHNIDVPRELLPAGEHFALEVRGDSMINAGILDGDTVVINRTHTANNGDIVVAYVIEEEEATLKRMRKKGESIALEAANPAFETRIFGPGQIEVQGRLVALIRKY